MPPWCQVKPVCSCCQITKCAMEVPVPCVEEHVLCFGRSLRLLVWLLHEEISPFSSVTKRPNQLGSDLNWCFFTFFYRPIKMQGTLSWTDWSTCFFNFKIDSENCSQNIWNYCFVLLSLPWPVGRRKRVMWSVLRDEQRCGFIWNIFSDATLFLLHFSLLLLCLFL